MPPVVGLHDLFVIFSVYLHPSLSLSVCRFFCVLDVCELVNKIAGKYCDLLPHVRSISLFRQDFVDFAIPTFFCCLNQFEKVALFQLSTLSLIKFSRGLEIYRYFPWRRLKKFKHFSRWRASSIWFRISLRHTILCLHPSTRLQLRPTGIFFSFSHTLTPASDRKAMWLNRWGLIR